MRLLSVFSMILLRNNKLVKYVVPPSCRHCKYFQSSLIFDGDYNLSKCTKFQDKNAGSQTVSYQYADIARKYEDLCGKNANHFEKR